MAIAEHAHPRLRSIVDEIARALGRLGVKEGSSAGAAAALRVTLEEDVRRVVQVYWTPFEADIPGHSIGLHLEVADPTVHWAEAYLSPTERNWVFVFAERADGEVQLERYGDYATPEEAIEDFFKLSSWHVLVATDKSWGDVVFEAAEDLGWGRDHRTYAGSISKAIDESLKKSTIFWLRWHTDGVERTMPVWYVYDQKVQKVYVLSGERQQTIPGARELRECDVILRWKGKNASVAEVPAGVRVMTGDDPDWDEIADKVAEKRLNIPGLPEDTARRWRDECVILELSLRP